MNPESFRGYSSNFIPYLGPQQSTTPQTHPVNEQPIQANDAGEDVQEETKKDSKKRPAAQKKTSKDYRLKKQQHMEELEESVKKLTEENKKLKEDLAAISKTVDFTTFDPYYKNIIEEMTLIVTNIHAVTFDKPITFPNMPPPALTGDPKEPQLLFLVQLYWFCVERVHKFHSVELNKLLNPAVQAKFAMWGYIPGGLPLPHLPTVEWFENFYIEAKLSESQISAVSVLVHHAKKSEADLGQERLVLDTELKTFFHYQSYGYQENDSTQTLVPPKFLEPIPFTEILKFTRKLTSLESNFIAQRSLVNRTHLQIVRNLSTPQHALFLLRNFEVTPCRSLSLISSLKKVWETVSSNDTILDLSVTDIKLPKNFSLSSLTSNTISTTTPTAITSPSSPSSSSPTPSPHTFLYNSMNTLENVTFGENYQNQNFVTSVENLLFETFQMPTHTPYTPY